MAYTRTRRIEFIKDSTSLLISKEYSADSVQSLSVSVADEATDAVIDMALTFARIKWLIVNTDQTILLESADGASANANSHTITANAPLIWFHDDPIDNPIDDGVLTKITKLLATNDSGSAANLSIEVGYDPTP